MSWVLCPCSAQAGVKSGGASELGWEGGLPPSSSDVLLLSHLSAGFSIRKHKKAIKVE